MWRFLFMLYFFWKVVMILFILGFYSWENFAKVRILGHDCILNKILSWCKQISSRILCTRGFCAWEKNFNEDLWQNVVHKNLWAFEWLLLALDNDSCLLGLSIITGNRVDSTVILQVLFPSSTTRLLSLGPPPVTSARPVTLLLKVVSVTPLHNRLGNSPLDTVAASPAPWCDDFVHLKIFFSWMDFVHETNLFTRVWIGICSHI
jgi:hypothetical protein